MAASLSPGAKTAIKGRFGYEFLNVLGRGSFSRVLLARQRATGQLYAVKVIDKEKATDTISTEFSVLQGNSCVPFLVSLHAAFQTVDRILLVMDYAAGGDFFSYLMRTRGGLDEASVRFYSAEIICALGFLHGRGILHRDLKPDNVLLDYYGHVMLADFGLCKPGIFGNMKTRSFNGTLFYMAPEMMLAQEYGRSVDWWSFGVMVYEMALNRYPFDITEKMGTDLVGIRNAVLNNPLHFYGSTSITRELADLVEHLLRLEPQMRLGSEPYDAEALRMHPFYIGVNWDDVPLKKLIPPFCPMAYLTHNEDVQFFDLTFGNQSISQSISLSTELPVQEIDCNRWD